MLERKCTKCQTWNKDEKFCKSCGEPLDFEEIQKKREKEQLIAEQSKEKDAFDRWMENMKNHKSVVVRTVYYLVYGVSIVFGAFGAFMAWLVAMANG